MMRLHLSTLPGWRGGGALRTPGFTLIELLVVVGIISILASIATPNFLEAQTRAKVSRVKNDARVVAVALESYSVDNTSYPYRSQASVMGLWNYHFGRCDTKMTEMSVLTTPIAYISILPVDIFNKREQEPFNVLDYWSREITRDILDREGTQLNAVSTSPGFAVVSYGPDNSLGYLGNPVGCPSASGNPARNTLYKTYDPTNGTVSYGNIFRLQSGGEGSTFFNKN